MCRFLEARQLSSDHFLVGISFQGSSQHARAVGPLGTPKATVKTWSAFDTPLFCHAVRTFENRNDWLNARSWFSLLALDVFRTPQPGALPVKMYFLSRTLPSRPNRVTVSCVTRGCYSSKRKSDGAQVLVFLEEWYIMAFGLSFSEPGHSS